MTKPLIKGEQPRQTPEDLFRLVAQHNLLARTHKDKGRDKEREEEHQACKSVIEEIINRDYGVISDTFKAMFKAGTGVDCQACNDTFKYAIARCYNKPGSGSGKTIEEIEKKYGTHTTGCAVIKDGILYIDPKQHCPG